MWPICSPSDKRRCNKYSACLPDRLQRGPGLLHRRTPAVCERTSRPKQTSASHSCNNNNVIAITIKNTRNRHNNNTSSNNNVSNNPWSPYTSHSWLMLLQCHSASNASPKGLGFRVGAYISPLCLGLRRPLNAQKIRSRQSPSVLACVARTTLWDPSRAEKCCCHHAWRESLSIHGKTVSTPKP